MFQNLYTIKSYITAHQSSLRGYHMPNYTPGIFSRGVHFGLLHQVTRFTFLRYHLIYVQITLYLNTEIKF